MSFAQRLSGFGAVVLVVVMLISLRGGQSGPQIAEVVNTSPPAVEGANSISSPTISPTNQNDNDTPSDNHQSSSAATDDNWAPQQYVGSEEFPYRYAEGVNGTYSFKKMVNHRSPNPKPAVAQGPSLASSFVPLLTVKRPPSPDVDPGYAANAAQRPVIAGVYRSPYLESTCDVALEPCETLKDPSLLSIADADANRPPINLIHCQNEVAPPADPSKPACGGPSHQGYTVMYRHRFPRRWFQSNLNEFPGEYSDIGYAPPFPVATATVPAAAAGRVAAGGEGSKGATNKWQFDEEHFADCNPTFGMSTLTSRRVGTGYGLTNRLLTSAGMMALGARVGRFVGLDNGHGRIPISSLVNLSTTRWPERLRFVKRCRSMAAVDARYRIAGKGKHAYAMIDRRMIVRRPQVTLKKLDIGFYHLRHMPSIVFHDMYLRYPYEQDMDLRTNAGTIFCGLQFADWIQNAAFTTIRRLRDIAWKTSNEQSRKYAALHFRQELSDSIAMRRGRQPTTTAHALQFLENVVAPLLQRRGIGVLVVCSGPLDTAMWNAMRSKGQSLGIHVISKSEVLAGQTKFNDFGTSGYDREGAVRIKVTAADGAAADTIIMEKADLVLLTTTSSLSSLIYAKRCGGSVHLGSSITWNRTRESLGLKNDDVSERFPGRIFDNYNSGCTLVGQVYLYDSYLDGSITNVVEYPCGYQFGEYIVAPPALVPRPPADKDVVTMRFKPDSVLYDNVSRNHGWGPKIILLG